MAGRQVAVIDSYGVRVLHAIRTGPEQWHYSIPTTAGVIIAGRAGMVSALADSIGHRCAEDHGVRLEVYPAAALPGYTSLAGLQIDRLGNAWVGDKYLPPHKYLLMIVPPAEVTDNDS